MDVRDANTADADAPRRLALAIPILGGAASLALTLYAGRHNHSILLVALFAGWVLSPFAFLFAVMRSAAKRQTREMSILGSAALLITLGTLCIYAPVAFGPHRPNTAFAFLAVPLASWMISGVVAFVARASSRRAGK